MPWQGQGWQWRWRWEYLDQQVVVVEVAGEGEQELGARLVVRAEEVEQVHDVVLRARCAFEC